MLFICISSYRPVKYKELEEPLTCQYGKQQCYIRMDLYESTGVVGYLWVKSSYVLSIPCATYSSTAARRALALRSVRNGSQHGRATQI